MPLNATEEELEIIRTALHAYRNSLQDRARVYCTGHSATGIDLCVQRMHVENVMFKLNQLTSSSRLVPLPIRVPAPSGSTQMLPNATMRRAA